MTLVRNGDGKWPKTAVRSLVALVQHGCRPIAWLPVPQHLKKPAARWLVEKGMAIAPYGRILHITPKGLGSIHLSGKDVAFFNRFKRDPRDMFVQVGAMFGNRFNPDFVTFRSHDTEHRYSVRMRSLMMSAPPWVKKEDAG